MLDSFPQSRYAPCVAIGLARYQWRTRLDRPIDFPRYKAYLDLLIDKHPANPFREEAFYLLARGYVFQKGGRPEAAKIAARLAEEYPDGAYAAKCSREIGVTQGAKSSRRGPAVRKRSGTGIFKGTGSAAVMEGPRRTLEAYLKALAAEDLDRAESLLAADFYGNFGDRADTRAAWETSVSQRNQVLISLDVQTCEERDTYHFASGKARARRVSWKGRICVVAGSLVTRAVNIWSGHESASRFSVEIALRKDGRAWLLISQKASSLNLRIAELARRLSSQLRSSFEEVELWDGERTFLLRDEIASRAAPGADNVDVVWTSTRLRMVGEYKEEAELRGNVAVRAARGDDESDAIRASATLVFKLLKDRLCLTKLDIRGPGETKSAATDIQKSGEMTPPATDESRGARGFLEIVVPLALAVGLCGILLVRRMRQSRG